MIQNGKAGISWSSPKPSWPCGHAEIRLIRQLSKINHHDAEITKEDCLEITLHSAKMIDYVGTYIAKTRLTEPPSAQKQHRFPIESRAKEAVNTATDVIIHLSVTKMKGLRELRKKVYHQQPLWSTPHIQPSIQPSIQLINCRLTHSAFVSNKRSNCTPTWTYRHIHQLFLFNIKTVLYIGILSNLHMLYRI